ncbi:MAG: DUF2357 domain-containing protein [Anaerovoracaceae bacterium]
MADTINDLYLKYVNKVGKTLENDRYFQYLFEMVSAGQNAIQQNNRILHKVVDERWLGTIEESLDAINNIIEKPRRYIKTTEEVVPVALARKITADSVRHLSMNTQFIASSEDGDIQPTKVLNVTTEETYDLYENRFIYHLIQRLVTFIDKRTDVIFWSTGDEITNTLKYESKVDDAYEEIEYKIEMNIKNRQSFAENDTDNMSVFMRIDRVRRLVMAMKNSSFCDIMAGCAKVRSPIQRTNMIMKDPNYKTCYKLWQFLESYDEIGYTIDVQDTAMEFDEDYLFQLYTNLITNYTVFKSLMEADNRKIDNPENKKRKRTIRPKFIKKIQEEIVDSYDIPDVEVRKVIIEEVTQAQLDAEAKLEEETAARKNAEEELDRLDGEMISLQQQISNLLAQVQDAEVRAEQERLAAETAKQKADAEAARADEAEAKIAGEEEKAAQAEAKAAEVILQAEAKIAQTRQESEAKIAQTRQESEAKIAQVCQETEEQIKLALCQAEDKVLKAQKEADEAVLKTKQEAEAELQRTRQTADARLEQTKREADAALEETRREADARLEATKREADARLEETKRETDAAWTKTVDRIQKENAESSAREKHELEERLMQEIYRLRQQTLALEKRSMEEKQKRDEMEQMLATARENVIKLDTRARDAELAAAKATERAANADVERDEALQQAKEALLQADRMEKKAREADKRAEAEAEARAKAQAKAEADSLTKAIARRLNRKYLKKNEDEDQLKH